MADWATCYPPPVEDENCPIPAETNGSDAMADEDVEEEACDALLCTGRPTFRETQTATVSLIRQLDPSSGDTSDPCAVEVDLGAAAPHVAVIEGQKKSDAMAMRNRMHFQRIPKTPGFLRSYTRQEASPGVCGVTRESARLKAIKERSLALYKHGVIWENQALDFYRKDQIHYDELKRTWEEVQSDCFAKQEKAVRAGEPKLIAERDELRKDICKKMATIDCYNDEISEIMDCDEYRLAVAERADLISKLAKYASEVKRQGLLLDLAREELAILMEKDRVNKFIRPELVGKCECNEYTEVIEEITQLTIDNDMLAAEYQLWQKLRQDFSKATRELLRIMLTDWNEHGEVHKYIKTMICFALECQARDMIRCIFRCPEPEHIPRMLCCELDCVVNGAKKVKAHYSGI